VSRRGEVRSLVRKKMLAQVEGERGYMLVNLYRDGRPRNFLVHRLVAMSFLGPIPAGKQINHKDGDKKNNCLENLEIVTPEQNRAHAARTGLLLRGEDNPSSRLTEEQVRAMRQRRDEGVRVRDIAHEFDVSEKTVYLICNRASWRHVM
jgi:DNA-directed RNA polymerase specialized sigma24 family protein